MPRYYAVRVGHTPGVYTTWAECKQNTYKFPKATFKSFDTRAEAEAFVRGGSQVVDDSSNGASDGAPSSGPNRLVVYTDGACQGKPRRAGSGVWFGHRDPRNISEPSPGRPTNQRAEAYAILLALRATQGPVEIRSDSQYGIKGATKAQAAYANTDLFEAIWVAMQGRDVRFRHVYGHTGVEGNEGADRLAVKACRV